MVAYSSPAVQTQFFKKAQALCLPKFPRVSFNNASVTKFGGFSYFEAFKQAIGWSILLQDIFIGPMHCIAIYSGSRIIDHMVDGVVLGQLRVSQLEHLRAEPGCYRIKGVIKNPSERTVCRLLKRATRELIKQLQSINQKILHLKASNEEPRVIGIDFDDSVLSAFGHQEGTAVNGQ